jgi:UDP-N-acetylmuramate dehydrogenase
MKILENYPLKSLNTFGLDVVSRLFVRITDIADLQYIVKDPALTSIPKMILGGGSNVLFTADYDGLIIQNCIEDIKVISEDEKYAVVRAGAGKNWHAFVLYTLERNYPGLENLSLIPGCVGAAPIQNIGAYGVEIKNTFHELTAMDLKDGTLKTFTNAECRFGYRDSIFKHEAKNRYAITDVTFRFNKNAMPNTSYGAIDEQLKIMNVVYPGIREVSKAVIAIRKSKLPDPAIIGNAGSFFKNPEITSEQFDKLKEKFSDVVGYHSTPGKIKLAAGWLIEQCGWKGKRIGNAGMHANQALVLVNYGGATGKELIQLAKNVKDSVQERFGIVLEMEVNIV